MVGFFFTVCDRDLTFRWKGGIVRKPPASDFMLIPQRPYLSVGTLRDQVIYPHSEAQMRARAYCDAHIDASLYSLNGSCQAV